MPTLTPLKQARQRAELAESRIAFLERLVATMATKSPTQTGQTLLGDEGEMSALVYPGPSALGPSVVTIHKWAGASSPNIQAWSLEEWRFDANSRAGRFGTDAYHAESNLAQSLSVGA